MRANKECGKHQQGLSLVGLMFMLAVLGFFGLLGLKIVPTVVEFRAVSSAIVLAKAAGSTVQEIRASFDKSANVNYIESISSKDLQIDKGDGGMEVSFAYEKKIPLFGPASLVLDYAGTTDRSGVAPAKPAQ